MSGSRFRDIWKLEAFPRERFDKKDLLKRHPRLFEDLLLYLEARNSDFLNERGPLIVDLFRDHIVAQGIQREDELLTLRTQYGTQDIRLVEVDDVSHRNEDLIGVKPESHEDLMYSVEVQIALGVV